MTNNRPDTVIRKHEVFLLLLSIYWIVGLYLADRFISYPIMAAALLLIALILLRNNILGLLMAVVTGAGSALMFLIALDEKDEILEASVMLNVFWMAGMVLSAVGLIIAILMLMDYAKRLVK